MASLFAEFLAELVGGVSGAIGAIIQDWEGETVDHFGHLDEMELLINAAQWGLIWRMFRFQSSDGRLQAIREILIETTQQKILITTLFDDYYLVLLMKKNTNLAEAVNTISEVSVFIRREMGL
ncbi:hypothetical protein KKF34_18850 [Myxococcota bacterium]|nr:hypothetical protein [Myxococcota bacterium]MBU1380812.1 hypothetical protein [Myxococcota bacterium]MBU1498946.1 hypothetical protein [Myxococcota bacterium]